MGPTHLACPWPTDPSTPSNLTHLLRVGFCSSCCRFHGLLPSVPLQDQNASKGKGQCVFGSSVPGMCSNPPYVLKTDIC